MPRWPRPLKYAPLGAYLARQPVNEVRLTLAEIEAILGQALPATARSPRFWSNYEGNRPARFWRAVGSRVARTHQTTGVDAVTFMRVENATAESLVPPR
jgi:hypothetical protein